jgi:hypothetical protein
VLRRLARAGGGRYVPASEAGSLGPLLMPDGPAAPAPAGVREIWSSPWIYAAVLGLLAAEWILRRRWGLR